MAEERVTLEATREEVEALRELLEIAVELKKTGILGLLKTIVGSGEALVSLALSDTPVFRGLALLQAAGEGIARLEPDEFAEARMNAEDGVECLVRGLKEASPENAGRVGLLGLLGALRDPRIQRGLGYLLALARGIGGCLEAKSSKK